MIDIEDFTARAQSLRGALPLDSGSLRD